MMGEAIDAHQHRQRERYRGSDDDCGEGYLPSILHPRPSP